VKLKCDLVPEKKDFAENFYVVEKTPNDNTVDV
jgi:hypothetical protein